MTASTVSITGTLYASIDAPLSDISLQGNSDLYGSAVGRMLTMKGGSAFHVDTSLAAFVSGGGASGSIELVK